jgi:hypothetical protein
VRMWDYRALYIRNERGTEGPPRVHVDTRDGSGVFLSSFSDVCGFHHSLTVVSLPPWYPAKGKYSLSTSSGCPACEVRGISLLRTLVNKL